MSGAHQPQPVQQIKNSFLDIILSRIITLLNYESTNGMKLTLQETLGPLLLSVAPVTPLKVSAS